MTCEKCGAEAHRDDSMNMRCNPCERLVRQCVCELLIQASNYTVFQTPDLLVNEYNQGELAIVDRHTGISIRVRSTDIGLRVVTARGEIKLAAGSSGLVEVYYTKA